MSASLVGSEMCIRDSACMHVCVRACVPACVPPCLQSRGRPCMHEWPACPVSYTHLTLPTICSV
eukprot:9775487-Alexandrium_andersonii.AAC.1